MSQFMVKFFTKNKKYSIADNPFSIDSKSTVSSLNLLIKSILKSDFASSNDDDLASKEVQNLLDEIDSTDFDFYITAEFLSKSLDEYIADKPDFQIESVIDIEYVERHPSPEPIDSIITDDWISSIRGHGDKVLLGCYDHTVQLWNTKGESLAIIPGHTGAVKAVAWVSSDEETDKFISASHDQSLIIWEWSHASNKVSGIQKCVGHKESVDCLDLNEDKTKFVSGSWDRMLKLWSLCEDGDLAEETQNKKIKTDVKTSTKTPIMTLGGHMESISSCKWMSPTEVCTASWDHTLKLWDVFVGQEKRSMSSANKIFLCVDFSPLNNLLVAGVNDRHVRLYDPRSTEGNLVKATMTSHTGWVSSVCWSKSNEHLFVSGSYDHLAKMWDIRNNKMPIYEMFGHEDKVLCVDWSLEKIILSGSADNTVKMFNSG